MNTPNLQGLSLAPHAVVRAARWSVDGLLSLASPMSEANDHGARLLAELQALWRHTLGSEPFRKALAVSHPDLYARLRHTACPTTLNKAARQLVATLYRQWARACWRTEPSGLWAGVGLTPLRVLREGSDAATVGRVAVAPHLQPFDAMLCALAGTAPYRQAGRFKVHPSAWREEAGVWLVRVSTPQANHTRRLRLRHIDPTAADACIGALAAQGSLPYAALLRVATRRLGSPETAQVLVDQLMAVRLLIGGLALPAVFETAWQALDKAGVELLPTHRAPWQDTVQHLRADCQRLEQHHACLGAEDVWQITQTATQRIEALANELGVGPLRLPRACLHWDAGLPTTFQLNESALAQVHLALAAHEHHHRQADPVVALDALHARSLDEGRPAGLRHLLATQPDWDGLAAALRAEGDDAGLTARLNTLRSLGPGTTTPLTAVRASAVPAAPFGALMLRLGRGSVLATGLSHEPWLAYARFGALLGRHAPHAHPLHAWCDSALTQFAQTAKVTLAQVRVSCGPLPNLLAQPRFSAARPLDLHGTTPGALPDAGLRLCHDGDRRWLASPHSARPVVALCATALDVGSRDPLLERVLLTGWRYRPAQAAAAWHDGGAAGQPRRLAPGVWRQRPRWRLEGEEARALAHAEPAERWALWQALARRCHWPELLTVSRDGEPAVLLPRDSALALEALVRAPGAAAPVFDIEAPEDECLITDPKGQRHATELIIVFSRDQHAWHLGGGPLAPVPARAGGTEAMACAHGGDGG